MKSGCRPTKIGGETVGTNSIIGILVAVIIIIVLIYVVTTLL